MFKKQSQKTPHEKKITQNDFSPLSRMVEEHMKREGFRRALKKAGKL